MQRDVDREVTLKVIDEHGRHVFKCSNSFMFCRQGLVLVPTPRAESVVWFAILHNYLTRNRVLETVRSYFKLHPSGIEESLSIAHEETQGARC